MTAHIIDFPVSAIKPRAQTRSPNAKRFRRGDSADYFCNALKRYVKGTVIDVEFDPLSGLQWRVLLLTEIGLTTWQDANKVRTWK